MARMLTDSANYQAIADAIRAKNGSEAAYSPAEMSTAISALNPDSSTLTAKFVGANGTYSAAEDGADGYSSVEVAVANTYSPEDEGSVLSGGVLVQQTALAVSASGTYDTTLNDEVTVDVPSAPVLAEKAVTANGAYDARDDSADGYRSVTVDVPNTYTAADEGKVVRSGALVGQTALSVTQNGTYDTTANDSVSVDVTGGSEFPSGYRPVEYLQTTDHQYCVVPFEFRQYDMVSYTVSLLTARDESGFAGNVGNGTWELYFANRQLHAPYAASPTAIPTGYSITPTAQSALGTPIQGAFMFTGVPTASSFNVGHYRADNYPFTGRIYGFAVSRVVDGVPQAAVDLRPCRRVSDDEPGLIDLASGTFYTNQGSGEFVAGGDIG